ncbi:hypothetical protein KSP39_PZI017619 [Platanthera zijinensis]|uniref:Exonuclease domain-containing protein n=1 Tax=Platanthera zijinensis TaxID=2320716 RepID=A0AAP0B601_9ASPA
MAELVFFDVETTAASAHCRRFWVVEFGSITVCPRKLVEVGSFCTLIRPPDLSVVATRRLSGITREAVAAAPMFEEVANHIFQILNGKVWAGHNIRRFDCHRIKEAFADLGRPPPEPVGVIDSLEVLSQDFGRRAGDLKMATLGSYFGLGQQKHRSLDDVRMNLEVLKHCATVLILESNLPHILPDRNRGCVSMGTRSNTHSTMRPCGQEESRKSPPESVRAARYRKGRLGNVIARAKEALRGAEDPNPLNELMRQSRLLLR